MTSNDYYSENLSAERLRRCYEIVSPRVQRYLDAEIKFLMDRVKPSDLVLELGCGYGRVLQKLVTKAKTVVGIDTSIASLKLVKRTTQVTSRCYLTRMNALETGFRDRQFDVVVCIQNGISAFRTDPQKLIKEAIRITCSGGTVLFSSYSEKFWQERLEWLKIQSEHGLVGEIDYNVTGGGVIVCKDGFRAGTFSPNDFSSLASELGIAAKITEVDESSLFCEIKNTSSP